jgi:hypothetical protein
MYILNNFICCTDFRDLLELRTHQLPTCVSFYTFLYNSNSRTVGKEVGIFTCRAKHVVWRFKYSVWFLDSSTYVLFIPPQLSWQPNPLMNWNYFSAWRRCCCVSLCALLRDDIFESNERALSVRKMVAVSEIFFRMNTHVPHLVCIKMCLSINGTSVVVNAIYHEGLSKYLA